MIADKKDADATFSLDQGCTIITDDAKPLIKVINYMFNFVSESTKAAMEVSLELRDKYYMLSFISNSASPLENLSLADGINDALKAYNANAELLIDGGSSLRVAITFNR
jgi:hypothetical protein